MFNTFKKILSYRINVQKFKKYFTGLFYVLAFVASLLVVVCLTSYLIVGDEYDDSASSTAQEESNNAQDCNIKGVSLLGSLMTYIPADSYNESGNLNQDLSSSEAIVGKIDEADKDDKIKAILLEIDSTGGSGVAAQEIEKALKNSSKPTAVLVRNGALSGAYWAATGANIIFASDISEIGSIGVTSSYIDFSKKNIKDGVTFNSLSTGKFKDIGSADKPLTQEERALIMKNLNAMSESFIKTVATNRKLDINKVKALADASSMMGQEALEKGLIDKLGNIKEVKEYLKEKIGQEAEICW